MLTLLYNEGVLQGTPSQIVHRLWKRCFYRPHLKTLKAYMEWKADIELKWSGRTIRTTDYRTFLTDLYRS